MDKDVVIIGAGIVGCSAAYHLASMGVEVTVYDPNGIAAGASGRNNGLIEHPYDAASEALFQENVELLGEVLGDSFPDEPLGTLIVSETEAQARAAGEMYSNFPSLVPQVLDPDQVRAAEPLLADGLWGCMLRTGHPVMPREVTERFAELAREAGAKFVLGSAVEISVREGQAVGVRAGGREHVAGAILAAAGAGTAELLSGLMPAGFVSPLWGVIVLVELVRRPNHPLIEGSLAAQHGTGEVEVQAPFTLLDSPGWLAVGSTMLEGQEPDGRLWQPRLLARGARFVPSIAQAHIQGTLVCARPRSFDNRPILGRAPDQERLWIATGHGGRGMSTGPASGRLIARAIISGSEASIAPELSAARLQSRVSPRAS